MSTNVASPHEHIQAADAQNLLRVYAFLLKRARQRRLEMADQAGPSVSTENDTTSQSNGTTPDDGDHPA